MNKYLLDTNIIIILWNKHPEIINDLIEKEKLIVLKEISEELVLKERIVYKGQQVLSERFSKLLFSILEIDKSEFSKFLSIIEGKEFKRRNLSENDLLLLYACYLNKNFILVTEDRYLFNVSKDLLGEERVMKLKSMIKKYLIVTT
ncbi:PIN domain-containing protein [Clostridium intestinale]|uniref:PIN domain-containing protein n=1 Tax=Clostridium intestinale TaxID=36845 RepID=UPI002DD69B78|nr:PIN domain-containing protein [Clostridium intestinale]WRY52155.1 PIN domain-containing protein [Clostridium intestinale]